MPCPYTEGAHEMAPVIKDSNTLTAPESPARSGSTSSESAVKAQPVALEIPITVNGARTAEGSDKREPFSESTKTVMVFGSGAVIKLTSAMAPGQLLFLTNEHTKKEVVCQVVKSKNYRNASGYVELEFTETAVGFWGMRFPGDRIGPGPQAAQTEARTPATGNGAPTPVRPAAPKVEQPAASSAPSVGAAKTPAPSPSVVNPAATGKVNAPDAPSQLDSTASRGASKSSTSGSVPAAPAPIATSLGGDTPLVEPWLKKREPAARVPVAPPSVAPAAPPGKPAEPDASLTPVRSFAVERPSERAASLFAPAQAPSNLASVDLSSLAPFFEVKPAPVEAPVAAPKPPATSDTGTEELKQQTARLQDELAKMQFAETSRSSTTQPETEKLETKEPETEKAVAPEMEVPSFPLSEQSIETLKTELVHESAVKLVEDPEPSHAAPVLPEMSKPDEPVKVEPSVAPIPALDLLEQEEMKIPAWLAPLAHNTSAPSSTQELALREKTKRRAEQPQLQELVAPLAAPKEEQRTAESRVPRFGSALPFEEAKRGRDSSQKKSGNGVLLAGIAAGVLALAGGGWWYMNQRAGGSHTGVASAGLTAGSGPSELQTSAVKESVLGTTPPRQEARFSEAKAAAVDSNATSNSASNGSGPAAASAAASGPHIVETNTNSLGGGSVVTKADSAQPEAVQAVEKKPALGEVHLAAPKISQKRTVQAGAAPDAGILSEEQPGADADSLGGL